MRSGKLQQSYPNQAHNIPIVYSSGHEYQEMSGIADIYWNRSQTQTGMVADYTRHIPYSSILIKSVPLCIETQIVLTKSCSGHSQNFIFRRVCCRAYIRVGRVVFVAYIFLMGSVEPFNDIVAAF
jgi:hypothetical protein